LDGLKGRDILKTGTWILIGIVLATVAYQIIERVPADTLSVALGVACGIGASVPVSVGLMMALLRQRQAPEAEVETREIEPARVRYPPTPPYLAAPTAPPQPQIIVLSPQGQFAPGQLAQSMPFPAQWTNSQYPFLQEQPDAVDAREWRIIGEE
jgi:hypothetical protein